MAKIEQIQSYIGLTLESSIILDFVRRLTCVGQAGYVITGYGSRAAAPVWGPRSAGTKS